MGLVALREETRKPPLLCPHTAQRKGQVTTGEKWLAICQPGSEPSPETDNACTLISDVQPVRNK